MNNSLARRSPWEVLAQAGVMVWSIVAVSALTLCGVFFILQQTVAYERSVAFHNVEDINTKIALSDEVRIRSLLASLDKVLLIIRDNYSASSKLTQLDLMRLLEVLNFEDELNPRISLVDASGNIVLSTVFGTDNQRRTTVNVADRDYFQKHKADPSDVLSIAVPLQGRMTDKWAVPITRRISNKDGSFAGVIAMLVDPFLFAEPFVQTSLGENATRAIMGLDGYTRLRLNGGKVVYGGDTRKSQLYTEIKKSKTGSYTAIASSDGVKRTVSYRVIDPYGIVILAGSSVDSVEASISDKVQSYTLTALVVAALVVLLTGLLIFGITRQRRMLEATQGFQKLIELVPQLISSFDRKGRILWVNERTVNFIGPSLEERARGFDWVRNAIAPDDRAHVNAFLARALALEHPTESCEYRRRKFDGSYQWFSSQITPVFGADGAVAYFLQTGTDIHDRKMAEERARITQKLESIGQLTGGMAHDFNNLLAIIVGNLDLAKPAIATAQAAEQVDVAISAAQRGVALVKSLLAIARRQPLQPKHIELWELIGRVSPLLRHAAGSRIIFECKPPATKVHVKVDEAGLEAVLLNLTVNARDAMPMGGNLSVRLDVTGDKARITVTDTGVGMTEELLQRATEPFFTTKDQGVGTGLGLSMVAGFVKQSSGTMAIHSSLGKGTTFEIFLPLTLGLAEPQQTLPTPEQAPAPAPSGKRRILVVDDEPALAKLVRTWANEAGYTAVVASSAEDALTLLASNRVDVLITDVMMPGPLDGLGLAKKAHVICPDLKILLMSGYAPEVSNNPAEMPWTLLPKPFRKEELLAALKA